jgi:GNAT superfamily N-acetyltransferase
MSADFADGLVRGPLQGKGSASAPDVDPALLQSWLSGRSFVRGLPQPVADHGGFRVDSHTDAEIRRWVFPKMGPGLEALARSIQEPLHFLKLCGVADELRSALPCGWALHDPNYFMVAGGARFERPLAEGYTPEVGRNGPVVEVRIWSDDGALAASGYAGETPSAFVYDKIVTSPEHRRKGLGQAVMATLHRARQNSASLELLVATEEGRALYSKLGWRTISPFSTASIVAR